MKKLTLALLCVIFATLCGCHHHHHHRHEKDVIHLQPTKPVPPKPHNTTIPPQAIKNHHAPAPYRQPGTKLPAPPPRY